MSKHQGKHNAKTTWVNLTRFPQKASSSIVRRITTAPALLTSNGSSLSLTRIQDSTVANGQEWANLTAVYAQFRVLSIKLWLTPFTAAQWTGVVGTDRSGALAPATTIAYIWGLQAPRLIVDQMTKPFSYEARAIDLEDQLFVPVGAPVAHFAIQLGVTTASATSNFAFYWVEYMVEFKGTVA